jgi:hypothetical protein
VLNNITNLLKPTLSYLRDILVIFDKQDPAAPKNE